METLSINGRKKFREYVDHRSRLATTSSLQKYACQKWWMSSSFNSTSKKLTIMFMDRGDTIPKTLPRTLKKEHLRGLFQKYGCSLDDHSKLIRAAHDMGRSATDSSFRGKGLGINIRAYIQNVANAGHYCVVSGRGKYEASSQTGSELIERGKDYGKPFAGTFVEWTVQI
jgi:hypothetical protein